MAGGRPGGVRQPERRLGQRPTGDDHATIKVELLYWPGTTFATRAEAEHALVRYIDGWYNRAASKPDSAGSHPTSTKISTIAQQHDPDR